MKDNSDQKLAVAQSEIEMILRKHDLGGVVFLASPERMSFFHHLTASWSVVTMEGNYVRFRSKREDFPSKEVQDFKTASTVHMLDSICRAAGEACLNLGKLIDMLKKHMTITHTQARTDPPRIPDNN